MAGGTKQLGEETGRAWIGKGIGMVWKAAQVCQVGAVVVGLVDAESSAGWPQVVVDLDQEMWRNECAQARFLSALKSTRMRPENGEDAGGCARNIAGDTEAGAGTARDGKDGYLQRTVKETDSPNWTR